MRRAVLLTLVSLLSLLLVSAPAAYAQDTVKPLSIVRVTPTGDDVDSARQIVLEFNRAVVPVGKMDRTAEEVGITITPDLNCQWRWLNPTSLACNLTDKDAMQPATDYTMAVSTAIKAQDGGTLEKPFEHRFTTRRPMATGANIKIWDTPVSPMLYVSFNQPVTAQSVDAALYFEDPDSKNRIGVKTEADAEDTRTFEQKNGQEVRDTWLVKPLSPLSPAQRIILGQKPGLVSLYGTQTGKDESSIREFFTFPDFAFKGLRCTTIAGTEVTLAMPSSQAQEKCDPMRPINLVFTSPVLRSAVAEHLNIAPTLGSADSKPWGTDNRDWSRLSDQRYSADGEFIITLPWGMKAATDFALGVTEQKYSIWEKIVAFFKREKLSPRTALKDEFGRPLSPFTLAFSTDNRKPNYELVYRDAVLEKAIDSDAPLYVNNLSDFSFTYDAVTGNGNYNGTTDATPLPADVRNIQYAVPIGVRSILKGQSGAVFGYLKTTPDVEKWDGAGRLFAQVTPFQVFSKLGHFKSSVWVVGLSDGAPVKDAKITIFKGALTNLRDAQIPVFTTTTDENGLASLPGLEDLDPALSLLQTWKDSGTRLFVRVDKDNDIALLPVSSDYEVQLWNINSDIYAYTTPKFSHMKTWGMTAQGIYRAGDTMDYKIYVRHQDNDRLIAPPAVPYSLSITDPAGKVVSEQKVTLNDFGTLSGTYKIPENGVVGWYSFKLSATLPVDGKDVSRDFYPMSVLVSDFTPAPFRVTTDLNGDAFKAGDKMEIKSSALLHSGGAYADAAIRSTITLQSQPFKTKDPVAKDFYFSTAMDGAEPRETLQQLEEKINDKGAWETTFTLPEKPQVYGRITVESAVRDERGKTIANAASADYAGVDRFVGLKSTDWVFTAQKPSTVQAIVTDEKGVPVAGTDVHVEIQREEVVSAKVKSAGNAYLNDNTVEWVSDSTCDIKPSQSPADCTFTPKTAGTYRAIAMTKDTKGRTHKTELYLWVTGADYVQWNDGRENALTIIPESTEYKVGDVARYLVKNPFPGAKALISVERYGVLDSFVKTLDGSAPVIEIPVKENYVPGFYVSVSVLSPRVDAPPPELGQVDMGKPAFRMGYARTDVPDPYKQIVITPKTAQDVYRPGDKVQLTIQSAIKNKTDGTDEPMELAVAVLDESVFDLIADGKKAFDPYDGFYALDSLDVANYSLMSRLTGRQKFEKKGANAGGDGGFDASMRDNFKFVSYWNPSITPDENGMASVEFTAPDNLTGWRVLVLAATKDERMGLGEANFKVNRPTEIRPFMPNQVREGDSFSAGFSVMNRTDKDRTIKVSIAASGDLDTSSKTLHEETLTIAPYKMASVMMPVQAALLPVDRAVETGAITFEATAGDEQDRDGIVQKLPVLKTRVLTTAATYGTTTDVTAKENLSIPQNIYADTGSVSLSLSPSVIAGLDGSFTYMKTYPYSCWEQKLTTAVLAAQYTALKPYLDEKTVWDDARDIPERTLTAASSYQAPNGGMTYFVAKDDYVDPYLSAYTALAFEWLKKSGYTAPVSVTKPLSDYLMGVLRNQNAPSYYSDAMLSTVRAVILAAYKHSGKITADDVMRLRGSMKQMSLFGQAHYMVAASAFPQTTHIARETLDAILAKGNESSGKFSFKDTVDGYFERILTTDLRDNCTVLTAMMMSPDKDVISDKAFKMVRMITQSRESRTHFENTQENAFCLNALQDYAAVYEKDAPAYTLTAKLGDSDMGSATFADVKDAPIVLSKTLEKSDAGKQETLNMTKNGDGRVYYGLRLQYAEINPKEKINAGIDIHREYAIKRDGKWELLPSPMALKKGDLVKVNLYVSLPGAGNFVVVNDPLPGAFETVNLDLATASAVDGADNIYDQITKSYWHEYPDWIPFGAYASGFYHRELKHDSVRFYADWLEAGNYQLSYTAQVIADGAFSIPSARAEEMYDADVFGTTESAQVKVEKAP